MKLLIFFDNSLINMITLALLLVSLNALAFLGYFFYKARKQLQAYGNFKPFHFTIGQIPEYTKEHEQFLIQHKEVLSTLRKWVEVNLATIPDQMANPNIVSEELRRLQGKFQAYLEIKR